MISKSSLVGVIVVVVACYYYLFKTADKLPSTIVTTNYGKVQGIISVSRDGRQYSEYLGIPFAKPPLGELRFESPQRPEKWDGVLDASKYGAECLQLNLFFGGTPAGVEDCLFLNVFTPEVSVGTGTLKPTIVFIHGGYFITGSANMYKLDYFMDEDVVFVTLNYRLASLGFLNTGDGLIRGNMGLKDQTLALKWVQENIAKFGGDPARVTLVGESAGGACVHHHLLSPMSKGLFHAAIAQSGGATAPWSTKMTDSLKQAQRFASNIKCPTSNTKEMVKCLKEASPEQIQEGHKESVSTFKDSNTLFAPTIETVRDENTFLAEHPSESISKGKQHRVPWITGYNSHEGLVFSPGIVRDPSVLKQIDANFENEMPKLIQIDPRIKEPHLKTVLSSVHDFYFGPGESVDSFDKMENFTNLITDQMWAVRVHNEAKAQSAFSPVHTYYYSYKGEFTITRLLLALQGKYPVIVEFLMHTLSEWFQTKVLGKEIQHHGTCHADELALLFKLEEMNEIKPGDKDYVMSKDLVKLWTSFAKNETPLKFRGKVWQPVQKSDKTVKYFQIDDVPDMIDQPNPERIQFWNDIEKSIKA